MAGGGTFVVLLTVGLEVASLDFEAFELLNFEAFEMVGDFEAFEFVGDLEAFEFFAELAWTPFAFSS